MSTWRFKDKFPSFVFGLGYVLRRDCRWKTGFQWKELWSRPGGTGHHHPKLLPQTFTKQQKLESSTRGRFEIPNELQANKLQLRCGIKKLSDSSGSDQKLGWSLNCENWHFKCFHAGESLSRCFVFEVFSSLQVCECLNRKSLEIVPKLIKSRIGSWSKCWWHYQKMIERIINLFR